MMLRNAAIFLSAPSECAFWIGSMIAREGHPAGQAR